MLAFILFLHVLTDTLHLDNFANIQPSTITQEYYPLPCQLDNPYVIQPVLITHDNRTNDTEQIVAAMQGGNLDFIESSNNRYRQVELRFAMNSDCTVNIARLRAEEMVSYTSDVAIYKPLRLLLNNPTKKYLIFDAENSYAGGGWSLINDDDSHVIAGHLHSGLSLIITVNAFVVAHEVAHMLGAVQLTAPHSTGFWHSYDISDIMSYRDNNATKLVLVCQYYQYLDCNHDDYFSLRDDNEYLNTHWNIADSPWLIHLDNWTILPIIGKQ